MGLRRDHPALGAFTRKRFPHWEYIADELAASLRTRMDHPDESCECKCQAHFFLAVYDEAKRRAKGYA